MPQRTNYRGVSLHTTGNRWRAAIDICRNGKRVSLWLGSYQDPETAAKVFDVAVWHLWKMGWKDWSRCKFNFPGVTKDKQPVPPPTVPTVLITAMLTDGLPEGDSPFRRND